MNSNLWNELSEKSREKVTEQYLKYTNALDNDDEDTNRETCLTSKILMESLFGKDNLNQKPRVKNWDDIEKHYPHILDFYTQTFTRLWQANEDTFDIKVFRKIVATFKISKIIELGYGGLIKDEEWENDETFLKYAITVTRNSIIYEESEYDQRFIAFRTEKLRNEFYANNKQLIKDYFMIG